ncbi:SGNH hydrolase domain-containing protein [Solirubrobacter phytolaccae]|uniref:SGNH hydrolase domain-containing protein n=1 Tax=Solirubrobacter phytolaccae TaxID=1404360 RepID=A0A9X3S5H8_9ACTN|nr:SGNH hydrolase domain-containing protein [Solirubrobacter phytolaccae]MDA0178924.1 SGNH hydrolase domain-containing protein [Solirubrobacter phytolaccae]
MITRCVLLVACAVALSLVSSASAATPRCFGAAARDPERPCTNPKLRLKVEPTVRQAPLVRGTPCARLPVEGLLSPCGFGVADASAQGYFALLGDSHAAHWRPALQTLARKEHLRGVQLTRNGCSLTTVPLAAPEAVRADCENWKAQAMSWLTRHPEVTTVFLAQKTPDPDDFLPDPVPVFSAQVSGYVEAWKWLPASVQHVHVIHDNPSMRTSTMACVSRALKRKRAPGPACAVPRATALPPDPAAAAVAQTDPGRFGLIDLSPFFCDAKSCYPVVGGVLVHKDVNHITRRFAETLAPFLERAVAGRA